MEQKSVLLVDDHAVTRVGLKELLLDFYPRLRIFESEDGDSMLRVLKANRVDVIILDIQMSDSDTLKLVEVISIKYPYIDILIFSMLPERIYGRRMLRAGAKGFLSKSAPVHEMKRAFDMIFKSRRYISAAMVEFLADDIRNNKPAEPFNALSPREFEIMKELVSGNSLNVIAKRLNLRPSTVGTYKARIFEKLQVQNIFELKDMAVLYDLA